MTTMLTYTTLDGEVLDLTALTDTERGHLERATGAWAAGVDYAQFANAMLYSRGNPLVAAAGGMVTRDVLVHPLYRALHDLADRLGIAQNRVGPAPGDADAPVDPLADVWLSTTEAATRKGVAVNAIHLAIERGELIARPRVPGGSWRLVSANSLSRWQPSTARQRAGKQRRAATVAG